MCNYYNQVLLLFLFILNLVYNAVWLSQQFSILPVVLVVLLSAIFAVVEAFVFAKLKQVPAKISFAYPLIKNHERNRELFVFQNAVTTNDVTAMVMGSVYSLDSMGINFNEYPSFLQCSKLRDSGLMNKA